MHHAEVDDGLHVPGAEDVLEFLPADVDLRVIDVLRLVGEGPPVDPDDAPLPVEDAREALAEAAADARDEDGALAAGRGDVPVVARGRADVRDVAHALTRKCAFAL